MSTAHKIIGIAALVGATFGGITIGHDVLPQDTKPVVNTVYDNTLHIMPCIEEDSRNCQWNADVVGNGEGRSFIDYNGRVFYAEK